MSNKKPMTTSAAARIQSHEARNNGGKTSKGTFSARAQKGAANNNANKK